MQNIDYETLYKNESISSKINFKLDKERERERLLLNPISTTTSAWLFNTIVP
jgi:hypothetical protein